MPRHAYNPVFAAADTVLSNITTAIAAHVTLRRDEDAPRRLAEFGYRCDRRYDDPAMTPCLARIALRPQPTPHRLLGRPEDHVQSGTLLASIHVH
jgi:hypothetical protein